jgi:hypothetical protein
VDYIITLHNNNKIKEIRNEPVVINNRQITLKCTNIDRIQLYDCEQRYIATYFYLFEQKGKITFEKKPYKKI